MSTTTHVLTRECVNHTFARSVNQAFCNIWGEYSGSLIEGVRQRLHGVDRHLAVVSRGQHGALPRVVLPCVPHHQQVILLEGQLFFVILVLLTPCEQRLSEEGPCREIGSSANRKEKRTCGKKHVWILTRKVFPVSTFVDKSRHT